MCPRGARLLAGHGGLLEPTKIVAHCLLIEAGDELVLVDTGYGLGDCSSPRRLGQPFRTFVRPVCDERESAIRQIEALGHDPADVKHIVNTHLDPDHAGGIGDFPEAQVHIHAAELAAAQSPSLKERARYIRSQWGENPQWVEYGAGGDTWFGFESIRLLPDLDAEIAMIPLPGHTAGHSGVVINTPDRLALPLRRRLLLPGRDRDPAPVHARLARLPGPEPARRQGPPPQPGAPPRAQARARRRGDALLLARRPDARGRPAPTRRRLTWISRRRRARRPISTWSRHGLPEGVVASAINLVAAAISPRQIRGIGFRIEQLLT